MFDAMVGYSFDARYRNPHAGLKLLFFAFASRPYLILLNTIIFYIVKNAITKVQI
jgi:hypothetical protein